MQAATQDIRFEFGKNWSRFLRVLNEDMIKSAEVSLQSMLKIENLRGRKFLDIGSGSGLSSLVARRLGAKVFSFDYDQNSYQCTKYLKEVNFPSDPDWQIEQGSVLDLNFLKRIEKNHGKFDIVYSWGVLHHTGEMWKALEYVDSFVATQGLLYLAIYNDQGIVSKIWRNIKKLYCLLPQGLRQVYVLVFLLAHWLPIFILDAFSGNPFKRWQDYKDARGMSPWYDMVDWIGGYPFEVARPEQILEFYRSRGYELLTLKTQRGNHGCCEYVFLKH